MIVKRTCISIFSIIGLVDQSKPCTQIYLQQVVRHGVRVVFPEQESDPVTGLV